MPKIRTARVFVQTPGSTAPKIRTSSVFVGGVAAAGPKIRTSRVFVSGNLGNAAPAKPVLSTAKTQIDALETMRIDCVSSDPDGFVASYIGSVTANTTGGDPQLTYDGASGFTVRGVPTLQGGSFTVAIQAVDNKGAQSAATSITITVARALRAVWNGTKLIPRVDSRYL